MIIQGFEQTAQANLMTVDITALRRGNTIKYALLMNLLFRELGIILPSFASWKDIKIIEPIDLTNPYKMTISIFLTENLEGNYLDVYSISN
ncbi:MAG: hypothetical protein ACTS8R_04775 [Arsenophonus sp. NC-QC1-MAG3]